jgi:hypothetical protein
MKSDADNNAEDFGAFIENFLREQELLTRLKQNDARMRASASPSHVRNECEQLVIDLMNYLASNCDVLDADYLVRRLPPHCPSRYWTHYYEAAV